MSRVNFLNHHWPRVSILRAQLLEEYYMLKILHLKLLASFHFCYTLNSNKQKDGKWNNNLIPFWEIIKVHQWRLIAFLQSSVSLFVYIESHFFNDSAQSVWIFIIQNHECQVPWSTLCSTQPFHLHSNASTHKHTQHKSNLKEFLVFKSYLFYIWIFHLHKHF